MNEILNENEKQLNEKRKRETINNNNLPKKEEHEI